MQFEVERPTGAYFGPLGVALLLRHCTGRPAEPVDLDELACRYESVGTPGAVEAARQLRDGLAMSRFSERLRKAGQAGPGSVVASSEVPQTSGAARSGCPPDADLRWWSVGRVASMLGISEELVRRLCRDGDLEATRLSVRGRPWRIDPESVAEYESRR